MTKASIPEQLILKLSL